ncbi:MAG: DUF4864 domain-containing protein [Herminiimonas sp.]|nr:DUF4864 domain-containing protein [Herminiimonas sp.]
MAFATVTALPVVLARAARVCLAALACLTLLTAPGARAAPSDNVSRADSRAIRATVQSQFDAFARDDAVAAFALAGTATRAQFSTPEKFMTVVKARYQAVYRHRVAFFTDAERVAGGVVQSVRLTDADDRVWVALYRMAREADGKWRILGCELLETTSVST